MTLNVNKNTEFWHGTWVECPTSGLEVQGSSPCAGMEEVTSTYVNMVSEPGYNPGGHLVGML